MTWSVGDEIKQHILYNEFHFLYKMQTYFKLSHASNDQLVITNELWYLSQEMR